MAYRNPKPNLYDEIIDAPIQQPEENIVAEYKLMKGVYFAFLDVLGFKQTFDENRKNPDDEFASAFKESFQYFSLLMNNAQFAKSDRQWNAGQTSDSLYFYTDRIDYLATFIKIYSHFSLYAMSKNVFFRGGIAKGDLHVAEPYQFYGDCVIKAYLLESNIAKRPWIAIDQNTYIDLEREGSVVAFLEGDPPPARKYIKPFVHIPDGELQSFIDVSAASLNKIGDAEWMEIRRNIQDNLERFEFDEKNYEKYAFLWKEQEGLNAQNKK